MTAWKTSEKMVRNLHVWPELESICENYQWGMSIGAQTKKTLSLQIFARLFPVIIRPEIHYSILEGLSDLVIKGCLVALEMSGAGLSDKGFG